MNNIGFYIVGVGASAGGQDALREFFSAIPSNNNAAFVVVTHLFRDHKSALPEILSRFTKMTVVRIEDQTKVEAGVVYVMPEDVIVQIKSGRLMLAPRPENHIINNSIDIFFESLAREAGPRAMAVVLSGMGSDGSEGALRIFNNGGDVFVQDPESTKFNSMPVATILKDHPDFILPPRELGIKVAEMIKVKSDKKEAPERKEASSMMRGSMR